VNAKRHRILLLITAAGLITQAALADSAKKETRAGNELYKQGKYDQAIEKYDQALLDGPELLEPKFNKANSYYRLDDLAAAEDLFRAVAAESKDMELVARAKYNLGNCSFRQGSKQKDSNLQKAIEDMQAAIVSWRGVLDIDPANEKAAKNIEVARLTIKDLLDQLKNQQKNQDPNQPSDPNQPGQQEQKQQQQPQDTQGEQSKENQQQSGGQKDPNEPKKDEQQAQQQQDQTKQQKADQADKTAQEILEKEQRDKKQRQLLQRSRYQPVEKDW